MKCVQVTSHAPCKTEINRGLGYSIVYNGSLLPNCGDVNVVLCKVLIIHMTPGHDSCRSLKLSHAFMFLSSIHTSKSFKLNFF